MFDEEDDKLLKDIDSFHKNHAGNLIALCKDCHKNIHKETTRGHIKRKSLEGKIILEEI